MRLIDDKGGQIGIISLSEARQIAWEAALDLVEIQPNAEPPVVRVMDYGKYLFKQNKQLTSQRKKQRQGKVKEVKFRPGTDKNDYEVKLRNLKGFLADGDKVKITVWFKGREMTHQELGAKVLERICEDLEDCGKIEFFPKLEGRQLVMILAPKKK